MTENAPFKRIVRCPNCGGPSEYSSENSFRPFCSERCQLIDLGQWASEGYRIPVNTAPAEDFSENDIDEE